MSENIEQEHGTQPLDYWRESARPLASLFFIIPLLAIYEIGILILGPSALRNGVDVWLRQFLEMLGFGQYFLLPLLTILFLLAWHHLKRQKWAVTPSILPLMLFESAVLGSLLLALAHWQASMMNLEITAESAPSVLPSEIVRRLIAYAGAGIYEELLFRLMLIPLLWFAASLIGIPKVPAAIAAILLSSLIFSAAHYNFFASAGDAFDWFSFLFRFSAGLVFACLFTFRGFGIAAGTHALYDVYVAMF